MKRRFSPDVERWYRFLRRKNNRIFGAYLFTQDNYMLLLGGVVGVLCGAGAVVFTESIHLITDFFFHKPAAWLGLSSLHSDLNWTTAAILVAAPAIGGAFVGALSQIFEGGKKGEGIPNVIDAVASKGGAIKRSVAALKTVQSALSIGAGGAGGKEGPIVQIGASIGSTFGQALNLSSDRLRILVGCGAAAGLSAAFNAPLGGALFAMEIILRTFNARSFSPIIIASVFGTWVARYWLGEEPAFAIPHYSLRSSYELIFYVGLGVASAVVAVYFVKSFLKIDELFDRLDSVPAWVRPALGGLLVGVVGLYLPGVYGWSHKSIDHSLYNQAPFYMLALYLVVKPLATGFTIGSGGSGGTFAPALFSGAMLGGLFGQAVNHFFPEIGAPPGAYALVGMGAVVAGVTHASLTALIMVFEMTGNYEIILPLMMTIIISSILSRAVLGGSLYTLKFDKEGNGLDIYGRKTSILRNIPVSELIEPYDDFASLTDDYRAVVDKLHDSRFNEILVKNGEGVVGRITFAHIKTIALDEEARSILPFLVAEDLLVPDVPEAPPGSNAEDALTQMEERDVEFLSVFAGDGSRRFLGVVAKQRALNVYQSELLLEENQSDLSLR
jgi:CIC family chloride channel protein